VVLNDNAWSIDKNVGAIAQYFHKVVTNPTLAAMHDRAAGLLERFGGKGRPADGRARRRRQPGAQSAREWPRGVRPQHYYGRWTATPAPANRDFKFLKQQNKP